MSDTSPIRALHHLQLLHLLQAMYGDVIVPPAVAGELQNPRPRFTPVPLSQFAFVRIQAPSQPSPHLHLLQGLDAGESEALALAVELRADYVLIDEAEGRAIGQQLGLSITGVIGVLIDAKALRLVPLVKPLLDELEQGLGFYLGGPFKQAVLKSVGE